MKAAWGPKPICWLPHLLSVLALNKSKTSGSALSFKQITVCCNILELRIDAYNLIWFKVVYSFIASTVTKLRHPCRVTICQVTVCSLFLKWVCWSKFVNNRQCFCFTLEAKGSASFLPCTIFGTQTSRTVTPSKGKAFLFAWFASYAPSTARMLLSPV